MSQADPYAELAELAEAALELTREGDEQGVAAMLDRSTGIAAGLPDRPPINARPALERAAAAQQRLTVWLDAKLAATRSELELVDRGRHAARSYAGAGAVLLDQQA